MKKETEYEIKVDNRILQALFEISGEVDRDLNSVFVFSGDGGVPVYFASDGHVAMNIREVEPEIAYNGEYVVEIPDVFKKIVGYKKKEENGAMNNTVIRWNDDEVILSMFNGSPFDISYSMRQTHKFDKIPDVFHYDTRAQEVVSFSLNAAKKIGAALGKLGVSTAPVFTLNGQQESFCGRIRTECFEVEFVMMKCRISETDEN